MKQKDLTLIIVVCIFAAVASLIVAKFVFAKPQGLSQKVEVVEAITTDFQTPDPRYINDKSYNPTQTITISDPGNATPFKPDGR